MTTTWHAPSDSLQRFATDPRSLDPTTASSIEQHLVSCAVCRGQVAAATGPSTLDAMWAEVADRIDRPRAALVERVAARLGFDPSHVRLAGATRSLQLAWLLSMAAVTAGAVLVATSRGTDAAYLALAPLLPLGSVAVVFAAGTEPGGEAVFATAMSGTRLVLRRAVVVLASTFAALAAGAIALPGLGIEDAAWVLPALGLAAAALALATVVPVEWATGGLAVGWLLTVFIVVQAPAAHPDLADTVLFGPAGQAVALAVGLVGGAAAYARRDALIPIAGPR